MRRPSAHGAYELPDGIGVPIRAFASLLLLATLGRGLCCRQKTAAGRMDSIFDEVGRHETRRFPAASRESELYNKNARVPTD